MGVSVEMIWSESFNSLQIRRQIATMMFIVVDGSVFYAAQMNTRR